MKRPFELVAEIQEKDAEIERLLTKHEKEKNLLLTVLDKQTTEIERLKTEIKDLLEQNAEWQKALVKAVEKRDQLTTKLADALESMPIVLHRSNTRKIETGRASPG